VLEHEVSQDVFDKSQAYGRAKAKFTAFNGLYGQLQNLAFYQFDILPKLWSWTGNLLLRFAPARFTGEISHSIVFILAFIVIHQILSLPSNIYNTFVLEEKFGFNKQTPKLFITDMIKNNLLAVIFVPPILAGFLSIIKKTGSQFFYYLWMFGAGLQVFMITIYPIVILPLFNKLSPLEEGKLKTDVEDLAKKLKFPLHELYVIDGSKRSAHSNAYFFGLPWKKHIVIYDTLIDKSENDEVVAVLAHELGHWSLGHTTKLFGISQVRQQAAVGCQKYTNNSAGPLLLHLLALLRVRQQQLSVRRLWLHQPAPHHRRIPPLFRHSGPPGHGHQASDEHPKPPV
jgi:STE24 endopeptidase